MITGKLKWGRKETRSPIQENLNVSNQILMQKRTMLVQLLLKNKMSQKVKEPVLSKEAKEMAQGAQIKGLMKTDLELKLGGMVQNKLLNVKKVMDKEVEDAEHQISFLA